MVINVVICDWTTSTFPFHLGADLHKCISYGPTNTNMPDSKISKPNRDFSFFISPQYLDHSRYTSRIEIVNVCTNFSVGFACFYRRICACRTVSLREVNEYAEKEMTDFFPRCVRELTD